MLTTIAARNLDVEMDAELLALVLVLAGHFDDDMVAHDVWKQMIEFFSLLPYMVLDGVRMGYIAQGDLQRKFHGAFLS